MHPYLSTDVAAFPAFLCLGIATGAAVAVRGAERAGIDAGRIALVVAICAVSSLVGAKLYSIVERGGPWTPLSWEVVYGYRYPGGIAGLVAAVFVLGRGRRLGVSAAALGDLFAPCVVFAMAVVRVGCFLGGCCFGTVTGVPWAVHFPVGSKAWEAHQEAGWIDAGAVHSLAVHPLQIYFVLECLAIGAVLLWLERRKEYDGQVLLVYLLLHGATRVALDFLRHQQAPHLQWTSLALAVIAAGALLARPRRVQRPAWGGG